MQIREKGKKVICIKTEYSKEKKRTFGRVVASQPRGMSTVSEKVCQLLTKEDVDELQEWLSKREEKEKVDRMNTRLSIVGMIMTGAADALEAGEELSESDAEKLLDGLDRLKKSLRKRGIKIVRQTPKKVVEDGRQLKLED